MTIDVDRGADAPVARVELYHMHRLPLAQQQAGVGVPQVMGPQSPKAATLDQLPKGVIQPCLGLQLGALDGLVTLLASAVAPPGEGSYTNCHQRPRLSTLRVILALAAK